MYSGKEAERAEGGTAYSEVGVAEDEKLAARGSWVGGYCAADAESAAESSEDGSGNVG